MGGEKMKPRKHPLGNKNGVGRQVTALRKQKRMKQCELLRELQLKGIEMSESALSKLEGQTRVVTDMELKALAEIFDISIDELVRPKK